MKFQLSYFKSEKMMLLKVLHFGNLEMPENLENSAMSTGLEMVSFHSNPKERQCQRMFKLLYSCTRFTCQEGNAQNPSIQASTVCELRISRGTVDLEKEDQIASIHWIIEKSRELQKNINFCFIDYTEAFDCVDHNKLEDS